MKAKLYLIPVAVNQKEWSLLQRWKKRWHLKDEESVIKTMIRKHSP